MNNIVQRLMTASDEISPFIPILVNALKLKSFVNCAIASQILCSENFCVWYQTVG